jgi:HSP20 family protein
MELTDLVPFRNRRRLGARSGALSPFERMHDEMERLFDDFTPQFSSFRELAPRAGLLASIDLSESDDALEVKADLPGLEEKDIDVTLRDGALLISGERKHETEERKKNYYRAERAYGSFSRSIPLPCEVDQDRIEAQFKKGVLTVRLPKTREVKEKQRKIEIRTA